MSRFAILACICFALAPSSLASARSIEGIAAIVNDEVISHYDVDQRTALFFITSGIEQSPDVQKQMHPQILRALIDERLQLQEAKRFEIEITEAEIQDGMKQVAADSSRSPAEISEFLAANNIDIATMHRQIEAELAWNQFIRRRFGRRISIGNSEINEQYKKAKRTINSPRYLVDEILLDGGSAADEQRIEKTAKEIIAQLQSGVNFAAIARQFSIAPSAASGGRLGWILPGQIAPQIDAALANMKPQQISPPIKTLAGTYIIALLDKSGGGGKDKYDLLQVSFPESVAERQITNFSTKFKTCKAAQKSAKTIGATQITRTGLLQIDDFNEKLQNLLANRAAGSVLPPIRQSTDTQIIIICDRKNDANTKISRDMIENSIYAQRVSMVSRRHLRDLRRDSVVEYR